LHRLVETGTPKTPLRRLLDDYSGHVDLNRLRALTDLYTSVSR